MCLFFCGNHEAETSSSSSDELPAFEYQYLDRVIFLDVDGVLHNESGNKGYFLPECMGHLREIIQQTDAVIVLSSSWRCTRGGIEHVNQALASYGIKPIVNITPVSGFSTRTDEILAFLRNNATIKHFAALDDMNLTVAHGARFAEHCLRVCKDTGLTAEDVVVCRAILQRRIPPQGDPHWPKPRCST